MSLLAIAIFPHAKRLCIPLVVTQRSIVAILVGDEVAAIGGNFPPVRGRIASAAIRIRVRAIVRSTGKWTVRPPEEGCVVAVLMAREYLPDVSDAAAVGTVLGEADILWIGESKAN